MNINQRQIRRIKQGLLTAIESEESLIDAHRTELRYVKSTGFTERFVPKVNKPYVARCERNIDAWKRVISELSE